MGKTSKYLKKYFESLAQNQTIEILPMTKSCEQCLYFQNITCFISGIKLNYEDMANECHYE